MSQSDENLSGCAPRPPLPPIPPPAYHPHPPPDVIPGGRSEIYSPPGGGHGYGVFVGGSGTYGQHGGGSGYGAPGGRSGNYGLPLGGSGGYGAPVGGPGSYVQSGYGAAGGGHSAYGPSGNIVGSYGVLEGGLGRNGQTGGGSGGVGATQSGQGVNNNYGRGGQSGFGGGGRGGSGGNICYAFQKGNCVRGSSCRFSHEPGNNGGSGSGSCSGNGRGFGGGRGGGKNRHMGDVASVLALLNGPGMTDADILKVIHPPMSERDRTHLVCRESDPYDTRATQLPGHADWRHSPTAGRVLNPASQTIRVNHFRVDTSSIPDRISHHHVHIYRYDREGALCDGDIAAEEDPRICVSLLTNLRRLHMEWEGIGITYDGRSGLFSSRSLPLPSENDKGEPCLSEDVHLINLNGTIAVKKYRVVVTLIASIFPPTGGAETWSDADQNTIRALDTTIFSFARWQIVLDTPEWLLVGSKAFKTNGHFFNLSPAYVAMRGFYSGLKSCMAGLVLVSDMAVTGFLASGQMINVMYQIGGYNSFQAFLEDCSSRQGLSKRTIEILIDGLKNCKVKLIHLGHFKKVRMIGPPANSPESSFEYEGRRVTVAEYYAEQAKTKEGYRDVMSASGYRLKYPQLPTINVGTVKKPVLVPAELLLVPGGQSRKNNITGDMTAQLIRFAAVRPDERYNYISDPTDNSTVVSVLRTDSTAAAFGVNKIASEPMACMATLLPQAKLKFGNTVLDPKLSGTWNIEGNTFAKLPPANDPKGYMYGVLIVTDRDPRNMLQLVNDFTETMEKDASRVGVKMRSGGPPLNSTDRPSDLQAKLGTMKKGGARLVLVVMINDCYCEVKLVADKLGQATQCLKWKNIERPPRGYHLNVILKINTKMGGTSHTLASRLPVPAPQTTFQDPPASISWLFDKPCMLVGMDVSHSELPNSRESMAAVVASMDGRASQYVAHISAQNPKVEIVAAVEDAFRRLIETFKSRNKEIPSYIVVYRDGVGDGQFEEVVQRELPAIKGALALLGYAEDAVKVAIVICQKGHHTRLVFEEKGADGKIHYINPCAGLVIDANGGKCSVSSSRINEFYLNSHTAIQGTSKPCKYALVYDEIGFKIAELEILTYWSCYLYARCNKSVSLATPAFYAHWASKRARNLFSAGATAEDLVNISDMWSQPNRHSSMFFI